MLLLLSKESLPVMVKGMIMKRFLRKCPLLVCFSFGVALFLLANFPHEVSGSQFLYDEDGEVVEVKSAEGSFQTSTKPRIIKFYSPYCVSDNRQGLCIPNVAHLVPG